MHKKKVFEDNYIAIKEMFDGNSRFPKSWDIEKLKLYQGYGGLKEVRLNPNESTGWNVSCLPFLSDVKKLHDLIL